MAGCGCGAFSGEGVGFSSVVDPPFRENGLILTTQPLLMCANGCLLTSVDALIAARPSLQLASATGLANQKFMLAPADVITTAFAPHERGY